MKQLGSIRAAAPVAALALTLVLAAPAAASPGPDDYCVQHGQTPAAPDVACPTGPNGFDAAHIFPDFADAVGKVNTTKVAGSTIMVEAGTYQEHADLTDPAAVSIFGDPSGPRPVITWGTDPTVTFTAALPSSLTLTHLEVDQTCTAAANAGCAGGDQAIVATNEADAFSDVKFQSAGPVARFFNVVDSVSLADVSVHELAGGAPADPTFAVLMTADSGQNTASVTASRLTIDTPTLQGGLEINEGTVSIDHATIDATKPSTSSASTTAALFLGGDSGSAISVSHSSVAGGSYALAGVTTGRLTVSNSLLTTAGAPPEDTVSTDLASPGAAVLGVTPAGMTLRNVTAVAGGGGMAVAAAGAISSVPIGPSEVDVTNSILRGGGTQDVLGLPSYPAGGSPGVVKIDHSDYRPKPNDGSVSGSGDIASDPLFVNGSVGASEDFHLKAGSFALDAGAAVPTGDTDLDGRIRPDAAGTAPDMGAYESALAAPGPPVCQPQSVTTITGTPIHLTLACSSVATLPATFAISSGPLNGTLSALDDARGTVTYTPHRGFSGNDQFTFHASNAVGTSANQIVTIAVTGAKPTLTGARETHRRWREGKALAKIARKSKTPVGTTFSFTLNTAAKVTFAFVHKHKRTRLTLAGRTGLNRVTFAGRISKRKRLRPGQYTAIITATNAAGKSRPARLRFKILGE